MVGGTALNHTNRFVSVTAAALILLASGARADANQLPGTLVTGQVTAVSGTEWIKVDGRNYRIKAGSAAAKAVSKLIPGQRVDVQLNGPANTAASEVINVVLHPEQ
jgi:hypothetical protein